VPLKTFLCAGSFLSVPCLLFYDISDGLTFGTADMQKRFFEWLEIYDNVENTNFHQAGLPRDFIRLAPLLRRFFLRVGKKGEVARHYPGRRFPGKADSASEESRPAPTSE